MATPCVDQILVGGDRKKIHIESILVERSERGKRMNHRGLYQSKNMGKGLHCNFGLNDAEHYPSDRDGSEVDIVLSEQRYSVETVPRVNVVPKRAPEIRHDIAIAIARGLRNARELTVEIMNDNLEQVEPSAMAPGGPWPVVWNGKGHVIFLEQERIATTRANYHTIWSATKMITGP
jgi:hypothetical protein